MVLLRRQQYRLADQASERLKITKSMITGKIFNSRYVLERAIRDHGLRMDVRKNAEKIGIFTSSSTASMGSI